jgi:WD40 repeat protein
MTAAVDAPAATVLWSTRIDDVPVALSIAAGHIAVAGAEGTAWILDAATGEPTATLTLPGGILHAALSPDATRVALAVPLGYGLYDTTGGDALLRSEGAWCATARWAGPGHLAVASGRVVDVIDAAGDNLWTTAPAPSTITDLAWLREGRRLAASAYNGVYCFEQHQSEPVTHYPYLGSHLALAIPATGRWITTGNQDASIHIWRTRDAEELTMSGYPDKVARLAFDDTGRWLANDGAPDISVWDFAGRSPS